MDNKKTTSLLRTIGFQSPIELNESGFVGSISYKGQNVKFNGKPFTDVVSEFNNKYSDRDSDGNKLTKNQKEFFKDSKVRDDDGNLLIMYHGTSSYGFTVFDYGKQKFGLFGNGFYFTADKSVADGYTTDKYGNQTENSGIYECYLNITNPIDMDAYADQKKWINAIAESLDETEGYVKGFLDDLIKERSESMNAPEMSIKNSDMFYVMKQVFYDLDFTKYDASETADGIIRSMGYDGITHIGGGRYRRSDTNRHRVYIALDQEQIKNITNENPTTDPDIRYSLRGINKDGIEVYETSDETKNLTWADRISRFEDLITNDYAGRTARFVRNGHTYYAVLDPNYSNKTLYGEKNFSRNGKKAYIKTGADGDLFDLIENSKYDGSRSDAKNHKAKDGFTDYFDYFVKDIQIDGKVYRLNATVKKSTGYDGGYTYTLYLKENKNKKASPAMASQNNGSLKGAGAASSNRVAQPSNGVNSEFRSDRNPDSIDNRTLLANALESTAQNDIEKKYISDYKANIEKINAEQEKLTKIRAEIKDMSFSKGARDDAWKKKMSNLRDEATKTANRINTYDKKLFKLESAKPLKDVLNREKAVAVKKAEAAGRDALNAYRERAAQTQRELMNRYKERTDRRKATEVRNKIKKVSEDLKSRLLSPTERKYVPKALVDGVIRVCNEIDPTGANQDTKYAQKYRSGIDALRDLKAQYDSIKDMDYDFSSEFNAEFSDNIERLAKSVGDTPLRDMSKAQLEDGTIESFAKVKEDQSFDTFMNMACEVASYLGIPLKNVYNIGNGIRLHVEDAINGEFLSFESGVERSPSQDYGRLYNAIVNGDTKEIGKLKEKYDDDYTKELRKALGANDPRIQDAAEARYNGNLEEYKRIALEIKGEGNFSQDDIVSAINSAYNKLDTDDGDSETGDKHKGLFDTSDLEAAIEGNVFEINEVLFFYGQPILGE